MTWRLARSIALLRHEVDVEWPNRSKASDGTLGDADHASRLSDHNPDSQGRVCAIDITHDPAHGCDAGELAEHFRRLGSVGDCRPKYVIWNRRIASPSSAWEWRAYDGSNPHTKHVHLSVTQSCADDTGTWGIREMGDGDLSAEGDYIKAQLRDVADRVNALSRKVDYAQAQNRAIAQLVVDENRASTTTLAEQIAAQIDGDCDVSAIEQAVRNVLLAGVGDA